MRQPEYDLGKPARLSASTLLISAGTSSDYSRTHAVLLLLQRPERPERFHCFPRTWRLPFEPRDVPGNCLFEIPRERGIVCHLAEVVDDVFHLSLASNSVLGLRRNDELAMGRARMGNA